MTPKLSLGSNEIHKFHQEKDKKVWTMKSRVMNPPGDGSIKLTYLEVQENLNSDNNFFKLFLES